MECLEIAFRKRLRRPGQIYPDIGDGVRSDDTFQEREAELDEGLYVAFEYGVVVHRLRPIDRPH